QEKCVYMGQQHVFEQGIETLKRLTGQSVCSKQIERMCHAYGELIEGEACSTPTVPLIQEEGYTYGMMDGSMIFT
ncbi:MAG: hypothetical protein AAGI25_16615, partial [Bacteroidota bacterium]